MIVGGGRIRALILLVNLIAGSTAGLCSCENPNSATLERGSLKWLNFGMMLARHWVIAIVLAGCLILLAVPAQAHTSEGVAGGFLSGFLHPILGYDHLVAMVAVGLWGAFLGTPAIWLLPIVFPTVMAIGGAIGILGIPMPAVDLLVAGSAVVLGACIALALRAPIWIAALLVGAFAIFHGHAHGSELPQAADPLAYAFGFVIATGLLHVSGIGLGLLSRYRAGEYGVRGLGVAIAVVGLTFLTGSV